MRRRFCQLMRRYIRVCVYRCTRVWVLFLSLFIIFVLLFLSYNSFSSIFKILKPKPTSRHYPPSSLFPPPSFALHTFSTCLRSTRHKETLKTQAQNSVPRPLSLSLLLQTQITQEKRKTTHSLSFSLTTAHPNPLP